jgi:hypothetical protein
MGMHPRLGGGIAIPVGHEGEGSLQEDNGFPFQELNRDFFELLEMAY